MTSDHDIAVFQRRIRDLEAQLSVERAGAVDSLLRAVTDGLDHGVFIWRLTRPDEPASLTAVYGNEAGQRYLGVDLRAHIGESIETIFPGALKTGMPQLFTTILQSGEAHDLGEQPYQDDITSGVFTMRAVPLDAQHLAVIFQNVTEQRNMQEALMQNMLQEQRIQAQQAALDELSTPLIPLTGDIVVMPLIGQIDSRRAQRVMETLLTGVAGVRARMVIIDITGVPIVDTQIANVLLHAAQAVRLLGAQVSISGIRPEVAQTLVSLGVDLSGIITHGSLQSSIAQALYQR